MKFKAIHKETGKTFKQWIKDSCREYQKDDRFMLGINEDGFLFYTKETVYCYEYSMSSHFLKRHEWIIQIATHKENGRWVYRELGCIEDNRKEEKEQEKEKTTVCEILCKSSVSL